MASDQFSIDADLTVTIDGTEVTVSSVDGRLRVEAPTISVARKLGDITDVVPPGLAAEAGRVRADIFVGGHRVAYTGPGVHPGPLSRAAGVTPAKLDVPGAIRALLI